ncbi:DUF5704 domain-containing protein [Lysinibacillus xylanilyticus]|uniref:DUF5704 domain-containing protein n=1 Tax=Lysinibacillus xylanilyticus TaxID=582475 RepID=UPI00381E88D2
MKLLKKGTIAIVSFFSLFICMFFLDDSLSASAKRTYYESDKIPITPAVHWWQIDDGHFRAKNFDGEKEVPFVGERGVTARPEQEWVFNKLNLHDYPMPTVFKNVDNDRDRKSLSDLKGVEALNPEWDVDANGFNYIGNDKKVVEGHYLELKVTTGGDLRASDVTVYGHNKDGEVKLNVKYDVPMWIQWIGYTEDEGTDPGGPSCSIDFVVGDGGSQKKSKIEPLPSGSISSDSGEFNVVQGIPSSENLRADAQSEEYLYEQDFLQKTGKTVFNNIHASKEFTLTWTTKHVDAEGDVTYEPHSETVKKETTVGGIERPFSYWQINKYNIWKLTHSEFTNYALPNQFLRIDAITNVTANGKHSDNVKDHVFPPDCPDIVLPSETRDGGSSKPSVPDISGEAKSAAEGKIGQNQVENDRAEFKGSVIMNDGRTTTNGPTPSNVPDPGMIQMTARGLLIDSLKTNYYQSPSTGKVFYAPVFSIDGSASDKNFPFDVNVVTVHTPVVIYARASDDKEHDQRTKPPLRSTPPDPEKDRHAFILDRPFTVTMPTKGQHRDIPGYGDRDFSKYIKEKQVKFPFDVYTKTKQGFYPANTWISVPLDIESVDFFMPVWVPEGQYTINFRSFAINALDSGDFGGSEHHANITIPNPAFNVQPAGNLSAAHVATDSIEVDVVGRLYDLHVTDIADFNWKSVFRESDSLTPTKNSYWVGLNGIDGDARGNSSLFTLPVRHGSHPEGYDNLAVKTGYAFKFDLKTKGNMFANNDAIRIKPTFYFVNKDGTGRQEVDLYYHDNTNYFVRIGSEKDKVYREIKLNEVARNVPQEELISNANYFYRHADEFGINDVISGFYPASYARKYIKHFSKDNIATGPYGWQILNWQLRTYRGPKENQVPANTMIPANDIVAREQTWYGEYSLPAKVYAVAKGTEIGAAAQVGRINENHPMFLKDGYIIVNFDTETIRNGDVDNPYLQYIHAHYMNQWYGMEGFKRSFVDKYGNSFNLLDGDVIFYHGDAGSDIDFAPSVTH